MSRGFIWSDQRIKLLKDMWWDGKSLSHCAARLGTNNTAVWAQVDRYQFGRNPAKVSHDRAQIAPQRRPDGSDVTIRDVRRLECRWPYGDASASTVLCGRTVDRGSYCAEHRRISAGKPLVPHA